MTSWRRISLLAVVALGLVLIGPPSPALAQQPTPTVTIAVEPAAVTGDEVAVSAYLTDPAGNPIYDEEVVFTVSGEFMNVSGQAVVGRDITDETGLALILFEPRTAGENVLTVSFAGNSVFASAADSKTLTVLEGGELYQELPPFRIPGANIWLITGVLATVWLIFILSLGNVALVNFRSRGGRQGADV